MMELLWIFLLKQRMETVFKTAGTTINGVAQAKIIHPDHEDFWQVKAYVVGLSESKTIELAFKEIITDFDVQFSEDNRAITIGPLKSFMNQLIPDGLEVILEVYNQNKPLDEVVKYSREGYVSFILNENKYKKGMYNIKVSLAGLERTFQKQLL